MINAAVSFCTTFIHSHLHEICFGVTAVSLMLFGPHINATIRVLTKKLHWLVRYAVFVVLCTIGYTFLSQVVYHGVNNLLRSCPSTVLIFVTVGIYLVLAWIAKEQKAI